jgi:hypothetical protein
MDDMMGVHLREGNRSYHANGYVVHSNYPEITMDRIEKGLQGLPTKDQDTAYVALSVLQPYIHYQFFVSMLTYPHSHIQYDLSDHHPKSNVHS